jgi:hypothetical protein
MPPTSGLAAAARIRGTGWRWRNSSEFRKTEIPCPRDVLSFTAERGLFVSAQFWALSLFLVRGRSKSKASALPIPESGSWSSLP